MANVTTTGIHYAQSSLTLLARITDAENAIIQQADVSTIKYESWIIEPPSVPTRVTAATSLTKTDVIFDALQTDDIWTVDEEGYNFRATLATTDFPQQVKTQYQGNPSVAQKVEVQFVLANGHVFYVPYEIEVRPILFGQ